jgi:hypothetical protein
MNEKTSLFIKQYYMESYRHYITQKHLFNTKNYCENCSIRNQDLRLLLNYDSFLNPNNSMFHAVESKRSEFIAFEAELYDIYYDEFEIKFPIDYKDLDFEPFIIM